MLKRDSWVVGGGLVAVVIIDRWLKSLAQRGVTGSWSIAHFQLFKNDRLVFSWPLSNVVATMFMLVAMITVLYLLWRAWRVRHGQAIIGASLMILGAASNFFDRIHYGYVIDWAYFGRWWPVFNLADVMITIGLLLLVFRQPRLDKVLPVT